MNIKTICALLDTTEDNLFETIKDLPEDEWDYYGDDDMTLEMFKTITQRYYPDKFELVELLLKDFSNAKNSALYQFAGDLSYAVDSYGSNIEFIKKL